MAEIWTVWWAWCALALALGIIEILAPGFIFLGFALGALGVGLLVALTPALGWPLLLLIFAKLSLLSWLALRRIFRLPHGQVKTFDTDIND